MWVTGSFSVDVVTRQTPGELWTTRGDLKRLLLSTTRLTRRCQPSPVFAEKLACWMNSFWCLLSFTSPSRLPSDILSFNSMAAWWGMEGAWDRVGVRRNWCKKKVCMGIKRLSLRLGGIHWLLHEVFKETLLFHELDIQLEQKCIFYITCPYTPYS